MIIKTVRDLKDELLKYPSDATFYVEYSKDMDEGVIEVEYVEFSNDKSGVLERLNYVRISSGTFR